MRNIVFVIMLIFVSCSSHEDYFKVTITDELNPEGFFAEPIEVNGEGKVIYKTHIYNENDNLYQNLFFGEMSKSQQDSVKMFIKNIKQYPLYMDFDSTQTAYKLNITTMVNGIKSSHVIVGNEFDEPITSFIDYLKSLPKATKRYSLKGNYFFETDNVCLGDR